MSEFGPSEPENITYVQISDSLMMSGDADAKWVDDYYATVYENMPGYNKPEHYMELPLWISVISGMAGDSYGQRVHIVSDVDESVEDLSEGQDALLFSTIESNVSYTRQLVERLPHKRILMGGHVDPLDFREYDNVHFLDKPEALTEYLKGLNTEAVPDNSLFAGQEVIPRLTLSAGCLFACEFCMVPRSVTTIPDEKIWKQVESFQPLSFELVYLDDKTFGQAPNWKMIGDIQDEITKYNPSFKGFIIQTTANVAAGDGRKDDGYLEAFSELGVKYTEIGVESVNPETFSAMKKPYHLKHLETVTEKARQIDMSIIPNFIFGHPLDEGRYDNFVAWTQENNDIIPAVNVNFLSVLFGAAQIRKQRNLPLAHDATDLDQNAYKKSWLSEGAIEEMLQAVRGVYHITSGEDFYPNAYKDSMTRVTAANVVLGAVDRARKQTPEQRPMLKTEASTVQPWRTILR